MRHTHLFLAFALSLIACGNAMAQPTNEQSLSHRLSLVQPGSMPTTNASARQGQWRIDWGHQRLKSTNIDTVGWFFSMDTLTFRDAKTNAHKDIRLGVSYTPWEHVTLGLGFGHSSSIRFLLSFYHCRTPTSWPPQWPRWSCRQPTTHSLASNGHGNAATRLRWGAVGSIRHCRSSCFSTDPSIMFARPYSPPSAKRWSSATQRSTTACRAECRYLAPTAPYRAR